MSKITVGTVETATGVPVEFPGGVSVGGTALATYEGVTLVGNAVDARVLAGSGGAEEVGYSATYNYTIGTVGEKLNRNLSIFDNFSADQIADAKTGSPSIDTTALIQASIDAAELAGEELLWEGVVLTGALYSSASNIKWVGRGGARVIQIPKSYPAGSCHINISGDKPSIKNIIFDGNMWNMGSTQGSQGLYIGTAVTAPTLSGVTITRYNSNGCVNYSKSGGKVVGNAKRGLFLDCHFDGNRGLGMNTYAAAYQTFLGCTFDQNGFGYQKVRANYADDSHDFEAFGLAIRMRSHHMEFIACHARDNGRDGMNVNQGSYAIKFAQCLAYGNDDGGFTIAKDNTNSNLPGEGEECYDLEYIDCEGYNNWTGGLVAYHTCHNVTVTGGRYYNNNRVAGRQVVASSYPSGIYIALNSTGINIDTKVYDDRQFVKITAHAGGLITAPGWVSGLMGYYPKVAFYSALNEFKGYGNITNESSGSVGVSSTAFHGVDLGAVVNGDYITQAVQHNGIFTDNGCKGYLSADGAGHRPGQPTNLTGRLIYSAGLASGQNITLPKERLSSTELITNPTFDADITGWTFSVPGGGSSAYHNGAFKRSAGALRIIAVSDASGDASMSSGALDAVKGEFLEMGGWVHAVGKGDALLRIYWTIDGVLLSTISWHPGGGWRYLKLGAMIPAGATQIIPRIMVFAGKTAYFDSMTLKAVEMHMDERDYSGFSSRKLPF